jgi:O-antigen/teichoic acid export membrane protein
MEKILSLISRKLRIDAHYLYKGFFWISLSTFVLFVANFIRSTVFANYFTPELYGNYRYVLSIIEITGALSLTGASVVISRSVAQGFEGTYRKGMLLYLKRSWVSILASCVVALYFFIKENHILGLSIAIAGLCAPLLQTLTMYGALLEGKKMQALTAKVQLFAIALPTAIITAVAMYTDSLLVIIATYFLSYITIHAFIAYLVNRIVRPNLLIDPKSGAFTFHVSVIGTLATITEQLDKVLLFHFASAGQLAMYSIATALPQQFNVLGKGLRTLIYPKISNQSIESLRKHIAYRAFLIALVSGVFFLGYILIAPFIFNTFFSQYKNGILYSQIYAFSIFLMIAIPYRSVLLAHSCTRELYQSKITTMVVRVLSLAALLPFYGLWGVILSYLLARFLEMGLFMYMVHFVITEKTTSQQNHEQPETKQLIEES